MKKIAIFSFLLLNNAFASYRLEDAPAMIADQMEKEITDTNEAFKDVSINSEAEDIQSWVLSRVRFQVKPFAEFDAKLVEVKVAPMFEFRWERKPPRGWENYKPPVSDTNTNGN